MIPTEDSHSGRVRASRTRVDESLEGSNPSSSARFMGLGLIFTPWQQKIEADTWFGSMEELGFE